MSYTKPDNTRNVYSVLEAIVFAGLFVRIWGLSQYAYNGDEMQFILIAKGATLAEVWQRGLIELHPPLLHFIRHYLLLLTPDVFFQRLSSVAAGMISVIGIYRLGVLLRGRAMGVFCALCMAFAPLAVSTSMVVRDYALFMAFLLWAIYFFVEYHREQRWTSLFWFASLMFLASATNFSGFLVVAACGLCEGFRLLAARRWKALLLFCLSFLPLALLGIFFYVHYMAVGTAGPVFSRIIFADTTLLASLVERFSDTCINIYYFFVPLGGIRNIPSEGPFAHIIPSLMLIGSVWLIVLQALGLYVMYKEARAVCYFVLVLWMVAFLASLLRFYPFAPSRHSFYLLPFFILPFGYLAEPLVRKILLSTALTRGGALSVILAALVVGSTDTYSHYADELSLRRDDLAAGQQYLSEHLQPGDAIIAGKYDYVAAYFYLLDAKDNGKTAYNSYADFPYFHDTLVLSPFTPPYNPYASWQSFHDDLALRVNAHGVSPQGKFWFVVYGWKNEEIWHLMQCKAVQPQINDFFSRDGVLIFSIREPAFSAFLKENAAWEQCYADYKRHSPLPFHKVTNP